MDVADGRRYGTVRSGHSLGCPFSSGAPLKATSARGPVSSMRAADSVVGMRTSCPAARSALTAGCASKSMQSMSSPNFVRNE